MRFSVRVCGHYDQEANAFSDFARALSAALRDLGHEVGALGEYAPGARPILFGVSNEDHEVPLDGIVFNTEQIDREFKFPQQYRCRTVWDYSAVNVERLARHGISAVHCPVGYHPVMESFSDASVKDIAVLFYGTPCPRRQKILNPVRTKTPGHVEVLSGLYGLSRDAVIAKAKIVLNLHFYEGSIHEIFRTSHLFANRVCVVSEDGGVDREIEALARRATGYAGGGGIADLCAKFCAVDEWGRDLPEAFEERRAIAERGYQAFRETSLALSVERALDLSASRAAC